MYASGWDFVCIALPSPFVPGFGLSVFLFCFVFYLKNFSLNKFFLNNFFLIFYFKKFFLNNFIFYFKKLINLFLKIFKNFFLINFFLIISFLIFYYNSFILFYFILFYFILFLSFFLFFLPFILSRADERLLVLQPGIRALPLRWESQLQDTGPQETSQLHIIPNGENLSEISISASRPSFTQRPASYSAGHPMPNN